MRLKIASILLFWFGVAWQFLRPFGLALEYLRAGTIEGNTLEYIFQDLGWFGIIYFSYTVFGHISHIVFGYWLSKGKMKGMVLGVSLSLYEIVSFLVPDINPVLFTPHGIAFRILFVIVIFLIITGRKELDNLKSENWRPWKNPKNEPISAL